MVKPRSSTSIVRQARHRIRTRENPSGDLHSLIPCSNTDEAMKDDEQQQSSRLMKKQAINLPQIEPKPLSESQRTLVMPHNMAMLSYEQRSQTPNDDYMEDCEEDEEDFQEEYDDADLEVSQLLANDDYDEFLDTIEYDDEEQQQAPPKTSQQKHATNGSQRLVAPSKDEEGTMCIKAPSSIKERPATPQLIIRFVMLQFYQKLIPFQTTDDSQATRTYSYIPLHYIYIYIFVLQRTRFIY